MILNDLERIYFEIDQNLMEKELEANWKGWNRKEREIQKKRHLNDEAYFVMIFSRLEDRIKDLSDRLIERQRSLDSWAYRRSWEVLHDRGRLNFMERVALLTEKGVQDYNTISDYFRERNNIAHGDHFQRTVFMNTAIPEMRRLFYELRPNYL